ncbi:MAG: hypothetical protein K0U72_07180 [Gammaproteobacteria bacterium]|nr:hypothetical protein [Gammaproteobacteria bacterium]
MAIQKHTRTENFAIDVDLDSDLELQMDDDELLFEEFLESDEKKRKRVSKRTRRTSDWRRVERVEEDRLLRLALADFDDYDFEFADDSSGSACSH